MSRLPVIGAAYAHGRTEVTARTAVNLWFEKRPEGEKAPVLATHLPARVDVSPVTASPAPMAFVPAVESTGYSWVITQTTLSKYILGSPTAFHSRALPVGSVEGTADLAEDGSRTVLATVNRLFTCAEYPDPLTQITFTGQTPISVTWISGYFVVLTFGGRIYWSADGVTFGALDYATAEFAKDAASRIITIGNLLVIFGQRSIEFWSSTGNADLPFQPMQGNALKIGVLEKSSVAVIDGQAFFWGYPASGEPGLYTLQGAQAVRLSTPDAEKAQPPGVPTVGGFSMGGHQIVALRYGTIKDTWWYDNSTTVWTRIPIGAPFHDSSNFVSSSETVYGQSHVRGNYFRMDPSTYDAAVAREIVTDHVTSPDLDRFTINKVRLDVSSAAQVSLFCSRDGGVTWGTERPALAASGEGAKGTVTFDRYGTSPMFTFKVTGTGKFLLSNIIINPKN